MNYLFSNNLFSHTSVIFIGGGIGSILRFLIGKAFYRVHTIFPFHTFLINILGCFIYGLWVFKIGKNIQHDSIIHQFVTIGLLGGFTTFSAFGYETFQMIHDKHIIDGLIYSGLSIILGVFTLYIGFRFSS